MTVSTGRMLCASPFLGTHTYPSPLPHEVGLFFLVDAEDAKLREVEKMGPSQHLNPCRLWTRKLRSSEVKVFQIRPDNQYWSHH